MLSIVTRESDNKQSFNCPQHLSQEGKRQSVGNYRLAICADHTQHWKDRNKVTGGREPEDHSANSTPSGRVAYSLNNPICSHPLQSHRTAFLFCPTYIHMDDTFYKNHLIRSNRITSRVNWMGFNLGDLQKKRTEEVINHWNIQCVFFFCSAWVWSPLTLLSMNEENKLIMMKMILFKRYII